ncbi:hypothetical protein B0T24DRAFT_670510 [Lasiosphaeria ovina]|uniref:Uncharacterized protein n=1 Tax=Lasiosphaeria ovina TaxID=92902 RepID=A0AAE0JVG0_9PEZI|nr:hypothetical protein B0T24DRAFT_670510 [Lasiosphaeria ovina]
MGSNVVLDAAYITNEWWPSIASSNGPRARYGHVLSPQLRGADDDDRREAEHERQLEADLVPGNAPPPYSLYSKTEKHDAELRPALVLELSISTPKPPGRTLSDDASTTNEPSFAAQVCPWNSTSVTAGRPATSSGNDNDDASCPAEGDRPTWRMAALQEKLAAFAHPHLDRGSLHGASCLKLLNTAFNNPLYDPPTPLDATPLVPLRSRPSLDSLASLPPVLTTNRPQLVQHEPKSQRQCFYESDPV